MSPGGASRVKPVESLNRNPTLKTQYTSVILLTGFNYNSNNDKRADYNADACWGGGRVREHVSRGIDSTMLSRSSIPQANVVLEKHRSINDGGHIGPT